MKNWWKYLSVVLLMYALTAGLLLPLKPGVETCSPSSVRSGTMATFDVVGYNTSYSQEGTMAWLKLIDNSFLSATEITILNPYDLKASFEIPETFPFEATVADATLIVHSQEDGTSVLPSAVFIQQTDATNTEIQATWSRDRPPQLQTKKGWLFPYRNILVETIRNTFYHVSLWFAMFVILLISVIRSIQYLRTNDISRDHQAHSLIIVGIVFGILGLATGSVWAKSTRGTYWTTDVKLNMAAISMLIYVGYILLRSAIEDRERQAVIASSYAIFAYFAMIPLLFVVPRLTDSLHPGNGGNPGLGGEDLDHTLRMVFYPAIIGFTLFGLWMGQLIYRLMTLKDQMLNIHK